MRKEFLIAALVCGCALAHVRRAPPHVLFMDATAFSRDRRPTAAGTQVHDGIVAADPSVLPLGTRIRVTGIGRYDGAYRVMDTGSAVKGRHIDLYLPSAAAAKRFGTKRVRVQILRMGGKDDAQKKEDAKQ